MDNQWFDALEKRAALDNPAPEWNSTDTCDWIIAGLFIMFLALCAADLV